MDIIKVYSEDREPLELLNRVLSKDLDYSSSIRKMRPSRKGSANYVSKFMCREEDSRLYISNLVSASLPFGLEVSYEGSSGHLGDMIYFYSLE